MSRLFLLGCLIVSVTVGASSPADADNLRRLEGASPWHLSYAEDSCRIVRQFGGEDEQITLILDRYAPGDRFYLVLAGHPLRHARPDRGALVRFGDYEAEQRVPFERASLGDLPAMVFSSSMKIGPPVERDDHEADDGEDAVEERAERAADRIAPERYRNARYIWFNTRGMTPTRLESGPMENLFSSFDACLDELLNHWGIDVEAHRSLKYAPLPISNPARWLDSGDYPRTALRRGEQALVHFRLSVDAEGQPTDCHIQRSTQGTGFAEAACIALIENARFLPAQDAEGNLIASYYVSSVFFTMQR